MDPPYRGNIVDELNKKIDNSETPELDSFFSLDLLPPVDNIPQDYQVQKSYDLQGIWPETPELDNWYSSDPFFTGSIIPEEQEVNTRYEPQTQLPEIPGLDNFLPFDHFSAEPNIPQDQELQSEPKVQRVQEEHIAMEAQETRELEEDIDKQIALNTVHRVETPAGSSAAHAVLQTGNSEENQAELLCVDTVNHPGNSEDDKITLSAPHDDIQTRTPQKEKVRLKCDLCEATFAYKQGLLRHKSILHKIGKSQFTCVECGKRFQTKTLFDKHVQKFHRTGSEEPPSTNAEIQNSSSRKEKERLNCDLCEATFANRYGLVRHKNIMHKLGESSRLKCDLCEATFRYPQGLVQHKKILHKVGECLFSCAECERRFQTKGHLNRHIESVHVVDPTVKKWHCTKCPLVYMSRRTLADHMRVVHDEQSGKHRCEECQKECLSSTKLREHIEAFHRNVVYECSTCGKSYRYRSDLKKHRKLKKH